MERMARPKKTEAEKRDLVLGVRLTSAEREELDARARLYGRSAAEFMRSRSFGYRLPAQVAEQQVQALAGVALLRLGVNLNQIARRMNEGGAAPAELRDLLARINAKLDQLDGLVESEELDQP